MKYMLINVAGMAKITAITARITKALPTHPKITPTRAIPSPQYLSGLACIHLLENTPVIIPQIKPTRGSMG
jgi:hypothetical protein